MPGERMTREQKQMALDLDAIEDLCERRKNGFATFEHEGQLMDAVPGLIAVLRAHPEALSQAQAPASGREDQDAG